MRYRILILLAMSAALCATVWALDDGGRAAAYDSYEDNEVASQFRWLDDPASLGPVALWKRSASEINQDWWRFNASAGQLIEIKFRKYTQEPNIGLPGYTFMIKYEVFGPFSSSASIYSYEYTYPRQGQPLTDRYRRDAFSFVAPDSAGANGNYFIHVYLDPGQGEWRTWGFYWLNVTATARPSLDSQRTYSGVMEMRGDYNVNYTFEDRFNINLNSQRDTGDLVRLHLHRSVSGAPVGMEAREVIRFGLSAVNYMVNRTYITSGTDQDVFFTADHTGMYEIRVFRGFNDPGVCTYQLDVTITSRALDGDDTPANANPVTKATTFRHVPIEMGYNNHEWYAAQMLAGDTVFKVTVDLEDASIDGHAYQLYVYDQRGFVMWSASNVVWEGEAYVYKSKLELPPPSVPTIFDEDQTYYIRLSTDPALCGGGVTGFRETYTMTVTLSNRPPVLDVPFEDLYEWDEDTSLAIELDSHFSDPDGDPMEYILYNKTASFIVDVASLNFEGWLNITPPKDWNGEVLWRLRAADKNAPDARHYIFIDLKLRVRNVPDLPRVNQTTIALSCDEEGSASASLRTLFYDVDPGAGGVLTFDYYDEGQTSVDVDLDRETGAFTLTPGPDVFGMFTMVFTAVDDQGEPVSGTVELTVAAVNDVPRIVSSVPGILMSEGDAPKDIALGAHFEDVDGDTLTYVLKFSKDLEGKVNVFNKNNVPTESTIVIELLDDDYYGTFAVNITAKDPSETWAQQDLLVTVSNVPDRPELEWSPDGNPPDIDEGWHVELKVTAVYDADLTEAGLHTYIWYLDDSVVVEHNVSSFTYYPDFDSAGKHTVKVFVRDPTGLEATSVPEWAVNVKDVNRKPTVTIRPFNVVGLTEKDLVTLVVNTTDPDGDELIINWWLLKEDKDESLGTGSPLTIKLPAGSLTIEVEVSDGRGPSVKDRLDLNIAKVEQTGGMSTMLLGLIAAIVVAVIVVVAMLALRGRDKGKGKPPKQKRSIFDRDDDDEDDDAADDAEAAAVPDYDELLRKSRG